MKKVTVRKVKAHVDPEHAATDDLREDAIGNNWADQEAKAAVNLHPCQSPAMQSELEAALKRAKLVVRTIASVTQAFPPLPKDRMTRPPINTEGARHKTEGGHDWTFASGFWRCAACLRMTMETSLTPQLVAQACPGPKPLVQDEAMISRGHTIARTVAVIPIVFLPQVRSVHGATSLWLGGALQGQADPSWCPGARPH